MNFLFKSACHVVDVLRVTNTYFIKGVEMNGFLKTSALASIVFALTACGTTQMAVKPEAKANVERIALIKVSEPDSYVAQDFGNPGMMFGAVGGAIAGASSANAAKSVHTIVADSKYSASDHFTTALQEKLTAAGYDVKIVSVKREKKHKLLESYESVNADGADAVLDVAIESIGYATEHPMFSPHWRPSSQVSVVLVDKQTGEKMYAEKFMYGYHNPLMSGTDIEAPEDYHFKNKEELFSDDDRVVSGIRHSVDAVTAQVQNNLKK